MPVRTIASIVLLVLAVALVVVAVRNRPALDPTVGALPDVDDAAAAPSAGPTPAVPDQPPAMRPDQPTGKGSEGAPPWDGALAVEQIPVLRPAPTLTNLDGWLQADGLSSLDQLRGSVTVLQFWTFSCSNCKATIPNLQGLREAHADRDDFAIVGVHHPEFPFEEDPTAVAEAAEELGVTWPIALDTDGRSFHSWQEGSRGYWPRTYVLDRDGQIRFDHVGEGRYGELNATVALLLAEEGDAP